MENMADISKIDTVFSSEEIKYVDSAFTMSGTKIGFNGSRDDLAVSEAEEATEEMVIDAPKKHNPEEKYDVQNLDYNMVYLYQGPRCPVLPSTNPACLKLETWLRLTNVEYDNVAGHKMKSRKGQLPFVLLNGEELTESPTLLPELGAHLNVSMDDWLTSDQRNISHCFIVMLENHFSHILNAWVAKNPQEMLKAYMITNLQQFIITKWPKPFLNLIFKRKMKRMSKKICAVELDVKDTEKLQLSAQEDLETLSSLLGDQMFFFGSSPCSLDICAFSYIAQLVYMTPDATCYLRDWLTSNCNNLVEMCNRIQAMAFPDWDELCAASQEEMRGSKSENNTGDKNETNDNVTEPKDDIKHSDDLVKKSR